jgi:magnesium chelatase family protein
VSGNTLIIAAVGKHHILMVGGPGCGKTSLASVMPGILPDPDEKEKIEITKIYSSCGMIQELQGNFFRRPFRTPHHNATISAITGGGLFPVPGEITLAHGGVLFLDEMNEFSQKILDQLRKPLEEQKISICRNKYTVEYPADFLLIGAANPCSCGNLLERNPQYPCTCSQQTIKKYLDHISGPLFDRIDIYTELFRVSHEDLPHSIREQNSSDSKTIRNHIMRTWDIQKKRCIRHQIQPFLNSRLPTELLTKVFELHDDILEFSSEVAGRLNLTVRSYQKMIRIARSIADYDNEEHIRKNHIAQAVQFRRK